MPAYTTKKFEVKVSGRSLEVIKKSAIAEGIPDGLVLKRMIFHEIEEKGKDLVEAGIIEERYDIHLFQLIVDSISIRKDKR